MALTVNPTLPVIAAQGVGGATAGVVLQPGTVVNAEVLQVADNLVQIAIANLAIDVLSEVPLQAGQSLQLAVSQTQNGIRLAIVGQGTGAATADAAGVAPNAPVNAAAPTALPNDPLTPLERIAVSVASESAAAQQQSLAPLFANLSAAAASTSLPPALQQAVMQVLAQQTGLDQTLTGSDMQNAVQKSGLFLEAELASGVVSSTAGVPDLKAALIVLRQTLAASLASTEDSPSTATEVADANAPGNEAAPAPKAASGAPSGPSPALAPSLSPESEIAGIQPSQPQLPLDKAALVVLAQALENAGPEDATARAVLNLTQGTLQEIPHAAGDVPAPMVTPANGPGGNVVVRALPQPPPPFRGALPSAQPVAGSSLPPNASLATVAHRLLDDTDAALARQTLLQVASLPDRVDSSGTRVDTPRWSFEIPFATPQGTAMAQFEISRDGGGSEVEAAKRAWQARFSLDVEPAGPVHALVTVSGERTSVRMWAERPATAAQLRAGAGELSQALTRAELQPGNIVIGEGTPPQPVPARAGHFLDRAL